MHYSTQKLQWQIFKLKFMTWERGMFFLNFIILRLREQKGLHSIFHSCLSTAI